MKRDSYDYYWDNYMETPPRYEELYDVVQSEEAYTKFTSAIGLGDLLEKPEGEDLQTEKPMESYTIVCKNRTWGRKTQFTYETVQDSQKVQNLLADTVGSWGKTAPRTKDKWYADLFNYGAVSAGNSIYNNSITGVVDDSSGVLIYDGMPWFDTEHPDKVGNTYSNFESAHSLTHDNLKTDYTTFTSTNNRDERGESIELSPDTLLIPPALRFTAQVILANTAIPGSADNDINVLAAIVSPMEWHHLTDADGWFLGRKKMGLMATDRLDVNIDFWQDETNKDYYASIMTRFGGVVTNWRYWFAANIATS
jgi:hypothetical protein